MHDFPQGERLWCWSPQAENGQLKPSASSDGSPYQILTVTVGAGGQTAMGKRWKRQGAWAEYAVRTISKWRCDDYFGRRPVQANLTSTRLRAQSVCGAGEPVARCSGGAMAPLSSEELTSVPLFRSIWVLSGWLTRLRSFKNPDRWGSRLEESWGKRNLVTCLFSLTVHVPTRLLVKRDIEHPMPSIVRRPPGPSD